MSNLIQITVEPHVETYITHLFGTRVYLSDDNLVTTLLKNIFEPFNKTDPGIIRPTKKYELGGWIEVFVSDGMLRKYGGFISTENLKGFSKTIDSLIKQEMVRWCHHPNRPDNFVDYNIKRFLDYYHFSEDNLTFDNLKRWYYRDRQRQEFRNNPDKSISLTIPLRLEHPLDRKPQLALFSNT